MWHAVNSAGVPVTDSVRFVYREEGQVFGHVSCCASRSAGSGVQPLVQYVVVKQMPMSDIAQAVSYLSAEL